MKLLIDQNLSHRLVKPLQERFPGSEQVRRLGLTDRRDTTIWDHARQHGFAILTQDEDFADLSSLRLTESYSAANGKSAQHAGSGIVRKPLAHDLHAIGS